MKHFFILFFSFSFSVWAQCPFGNNSRVECRHGCDIFIDRNGDGYCDYSRLLIRETADTTALKIDTTKQREKNRNLPLPPKVQPLAEEPQTISDTLPNESEIISEEIPATAELPFKKPYRLILISALTLGGYFLTFLLARFGILHKVYHRRLWNTLLLLTAAVSCLFGFFLVIQLNYGLLGSWYRPILTWHVECGIAMTIILVFHLVWHLPYYKRLFKKVKKNTDENL